MIEKKKTMVGENMKKVPVSHRGGHGPGSNKFHGEKPSDFKATWGKLIKYSKNHIPAVIVAIVFAMIATIVSLVGPNI